MACEPHSKDLTVGGGHRVLSMSMCCEVVRYGTTVVTLVTAPYRTFGRRFPFQKESTVRAWYEYRSTVQYSTVQYSTVQYSTVLVRVQRVSTRTRIHTVDEVPYSSRRTVVGIVDIVGSRK